MTDTTAPRTTGAVAAGLATLAADGTVLDTWFPAPELSAEPGPAGTERLSAERGRRAARRGRRARRSARTPAAASRSSRSVRSSPRSTTSRSTRTTPTCACTCSRHRLVQPHGQSLDGIFGLLANVAWTSLGPVAVDDVEKVRLNARAEGLHLQVTSHRQVPADDGLRRPQGRPHRRRRPGPPRRAPRRRARPSCTRASSTSTPARSAPRWSRAASPRASSSATAPTSAAARPPWARSPAAASVRIAIGERCLIGAEAGVGIALGDECVVEAGLYVTAGTRVTMPDGQIVKARELSGASQHPLPPQLGHRHGRGPPEQRGLGRPERGPAQPQLITAVAAGGRP